MNGKNNCNIDTEFLYKNKYIKFDEYQIKVLQLIKEILKNNTNRNYKNSYHKSLYKILETIRTKILNQKIFSQFKKNNINRDSNSNQIKGIYLQGKPGTGKTMLFNYVIEKHIPSSNILKIHFSHIIIKLYKYFYEYKSSNKLLKSKSIFSNFLYSFPENNDKIIDNIVEKYFDYEFIFIDELDIQDIASCSLILNFITSCYRHNIVIFFTSNFPP
ncbi:MAG TPA: AAA family ATPase, partial [Candidatus Megaira endosymbiont of Hartmannula sinica]|nr:AAA family ATPase [Candidatus Megaera endosymbiont of Hartmannula sinica]